MEGKQLKSVYLHFRFKFLAITVISFILYVILSSPGDFSQFASTDQFKLLGPFLILSGIFYLVFKKVPVKCPNALKYWQQNKIGFALIVINTRTKNVI